MSDQRKPLEGWTYDPEPNERGNYAVFNAHGGSFSWALAREIGIPAPPEPRTGRLGLNEADTRTIACRALSVADADWARCYNAATAMCREDVAEWNAADNAEPDTLTVTLPLAAVRHATVEWDERDPDGLRRHIGAACRAALTEAGLS